MACNSLTLLARECGKNGVVSGLKNDVYLMAYSDAVILTGSTEVWSYGTGATPSVDNIGVASGKTFVKYGALADQNSIKEDYTFDAATGTYNIVKSLTFSLNNVGSLAQKVAIENLVSQPVIALVRLKYNNTWIALGLNGSLQTATIAGAVDSKSNNRVVTISGSDSEFLQIVNPLLIPSIVTL